MTPNTIPVSKNSRIAVNFRSTLDASKIFIRVFGLDTEGKECSYFGSALSTDGTGQLQNVLFNVGFVGHVYSICLTTNSYNDKANGFYAQCYLTENEAIPSARFFQGYLSAVSTPTMSITTSLNWAWGNGDNVPYVGVA